MRSDRVQNPLRAVAAELALLASEDVDAILLELGPDQRTRLRALLAEQASGGDEPVRPADLSTMFSPWLAERISGHGPASAGLTDQTRRTLAKLASDLSPAPARQARQPAMSSSPGLFQRFMAGDSRR